MSATFFGPAPRSLYGVYHAAGSTSATLGVVLCGPFGLEALRAHIAFRQLATRLTRAGVAVLRFDYSGTGDSMGDLSDARLADWVDDTHAAVERLCASGPTRRVALVGLRLGTVVAARVAAARTDVDRLVLWEPVIDGAAHVDEMLADHAAWMTDQVGPAAAAASRDEVLGFPLPAALRVDLAAISLCDPWARTPRTLLLGRAPHDRRAALGDMLRVAGAQVEQRTVPGPAIWGPSQAIDQALVPNASIQSIVDWLTGSGA